MLDGVVMVFASITLIAATALLYVKLAKLPKRALYFSLLLTCKTPNPSLDFVILKVPWDLEIKNIQDRKITAVIAPISSIFADSFEITG